MRQFAAAAILFALAMPAVADEPRIATLSASGEGSVSVVPDIAIVTIGVVTRAETAREALDTNNVELRNVIETILGEGIKETDVGTSGFSVDPIYQGKPDRSSMSGYEDIPKIIGYQVSNEVRVTIRDVARSGGVLDKVVTAGANRINGIQFDVSDIQTPSDAALKQAIADARKKAELMAEASGVRLVRILDINAASGVPRFARAEMRAVSDSVPVMPGERQVTANANISWEIAPN